MNRIPNATEPLDLVQHFGANAAEARRVLDTIESEPSRAWRADDIIEATGLSPMNVLLVLARGTVLNLIDHPALGVYRARPSVRLGLRRPA